jgi:hypothetical protein
MAIFLETDRMNLRRFSDGEEDAYDAVGQVRVGGQLRDGLRL